MLVQTFNPDHPAILAAVRHDYAAFAAGELPLRKLLGYPPFASMIRLVVRGPQEETTGEFAAHVGQRLGECLRSRGRPARACWARPRRRLPSCAGKYRFQIQVQGARRRAAPRRRCARPPPT